MNQIRRREQDEPAHDWQVPVLLERALAIARDVAIGDTGIAPVVIALRPGQPPLTLFIESDRDPASADCLAAAIEAFLASAEATAWLMLDECVSEIAAGDQPADRLVCMAGTRSPEGTTQDTLLLGIERDALGVITALRPGLAQRGLGDGPANRRGVRRPGG